MGFIIRVFCFVLLFSYTTIFAVVQNNYHFTSVKDAQRFQKLISELRCLVCQNQSLSESNAPLALDLKNEIYKQVALGLSDTQIKNYLVQRYGEYILFKPVINETTMLLWLGPLIFLIGGVGIMLLSIRRQAKASMAEVS